MKKEKINTKEMITRRAKKFEDEYTQGIHFDIRSQGSCFITMQTNAGPLTVYIDSMDGLTDPPLVEAEIFGRKSKCMFLK
tara:strand:+ start:740 stop:979 length:240 start_codon:yes stop_codon:yes gene_type:complete